MDTCDLILAYIQDQLDDPQRTAFETQMDQDPDLLAQVTALQAARSVMSAQPDDMDTRGWERLSRAINQDAVGQNTGKPANSNRPLGFGLLQVACIAAVSILGWNIFEGRVLAPDNGGFMPASVQQQDQVVLQVIFAPQAALGDVSAVLGDLEGSIISGPSAVGLYRISFQTIKQSDAAFDRLSSDATLGLTVLKE